MELRNENEIDLDELLGDATPNNEHSLKIVNLVSALRDPPPVPAELLRGVLRKGHKMMITADSKAGKSWAMIELACSVACGERWLGTIETEKGKVLFVNAELSDASCFHRFSTVCKALGKPFNLMSDIDVANLRGQGLNIEDVTNEIINAVQRDKYDLVIIDPVYKLFNGSENDQDVVTSFCERLDMIANTGASVVYTHHHTKGGQSFKSSLDRGSGSGVFARDVDAHMDMLEVVCPPELKGTSESKRAYRCEFTLREFPQHPDIGLVFECPIHHYDNSRRIIDAVPIDQVRGTRNSEAHRRNKAERNKLKYNKAFEACAEDGEAKPSDMARILKCTERTVKNNAEKYGFVKGRGVIQETGKMEK